MHVFVSYDSHDEAFADELRKNLKKLGIRVWNPTVELLPGSNWLLETGRALERADAIVFLVSSHSARSRWTRYEMQYALTQRRFEDRVIPVVLGCTRSVDHARLHDFRRRVGRRRARTHSGRTTAAKADREETIKPEAGFVEGPSHPHRPPPGQVCRIALTRS